MAEELNPQSVSTPQTPAAAPAPVSSPQTTSQTSTPDPVLSWASNYGVDTSRFKTGEEFFTTALSQAEARAGQAARQQFESDPQYQTYRQRQADFEKWHSQQQEEAKKAAEAEAAKQQFQWKPRPALSPQARTFRHAIPRDPATGRFKSPAPELAKYADELNAYEDWRDYADEQYADPVQLVNQIVGPHFQQWAPQIQEYVQQQVQQAIAGLVFTQQAQRELESQREELYELDPQGQIQYNADGSERLKPAGQAMLKFANDARAIFQSMTGQDPSRCPPAAIKQYVDQNMQLWRSAQQVQASPPAVPQTPAQTIASQRRQPNVLERSRNGNGHIRGSDTAPPGVVSPRNSREAVSQAVAETLREAGIPTGVPS